MRKTGKRPKKSIFEIDISIGGVSRTQKALFAKHLAVMLKSGLSIIEALEVARKSAKGKLKKTIDDILRSTRSGRPLSDSMAEHPKEFSGFFVNAVYAGEASGTLIENLENIAEQLEKERQLISKIKGAMLYPVVVLIATFVLGMILSFVVLPKITPLFEGLNVDLPVTTKALIAFSHLVQEKGVILFVGIIGVVGFVAWIVGQKFSQPVTHWLLLHVPVINRITRNANLAQFSRTLGMLLKSGVNIDEAMEITRDATGNFYYKRALDSSGRRIQRGSKLSENLERHGDLFPVLVVQMIRVGEESGRFEETLFYLADFYESEVDTATKSLSTAIEPMLLMVIGAVVGFLALSIITPIYDITGNVSR